MTLRLRLAKIVQVNTRIESANWKRTDENGQLDVEKTNQVCNNPERSTSRPAQRLLRGWGEIVSIES